MDQEIRKRTIEKVFRTTQEVNVETEMALPDYCPEVSRILDTSVSLSEEAVTVTSDKIAVSGKARICVVYTGEDGRPSSYETVCKYTKAFGGAAFEATDCCCIRQKAGPLNFKAVAPRRIELRLTAVIEADVYRVVTFPGIELSAPAGVQRHTFETDVFDSELLTSVRLNLNDRLPLPVEKDKLSGLYQMRSVLQLNEIKTISNKILFTGNVQIGYGCIDTDGVMYSGLEHSVPFSEVKEVYGVSETTEIHVCVRTPETSVDLRSASYGEKEASVEIVADLIVTGGASDCVSFADDVYLPGGEIEAEMKEASVSTRARDVLVTQSFSYTAGNVDKEIASVKDVLSSELQYGQSSSGCGMEIVSTFRVHAILDLKDGSIYCISRKVSVSVPIPETDENDLPYIDVRMDRLKASLEPSGEIGFSGEITANGFCIEQMRKKLVVSLGKGKQNPAADSPIILYYANKGENVWDISKENDVRYDKVLDYNELDGDLISGDTILLLD